MIAFTVHGVFKIAWFTDAYLCMLSKQQCLLHCPLSYKRIWMFICIVVFISALPWNPVPCLKTLMNINFQIRQTYWSFVNIYLARICNAYYVLFLLLCIILVMYYSYCSVLFLLLCIFCIFCFHAPNGTLRLSWQVCRAFSSVVRQMPGYNSQRRGTASTLPSYVVNCVVNYYTLYI
jgi:hypothetical protein